ncbi:MAG: hypothetical protein QOJ94_2586 [Sphingomonadales bacterium]|jgi:hypothetical protein|nr:hypothetical protein [Sphingomonadales bacterium]
MGYPFSSKLLRGFSKLEPPQQLKAAHDNYWSAGMFSERIDLAEPFFTDLVGLLGKTEEGAYGGDCFKPMALTCVAMSIGTDPQLIASFYKLNPLLVGTFLVQCMRINNRQNHSPGALKQFKALFDALGITVVGPWDKCVAIASFGATTFDGGTLTVEL